MYVWLPMVLSDLYLIVARDFFFLFITFTPHFVGARESSHFKAAYKSFSKLNKYTNQ